MSKSNTTAEFLKSHKFSRLWSSENLHSYYETALYLLKIMCGPWFLDTELFYRYYLKKILIQSMIIAFLTYLSCMKIK